MTKGWRHEPARHALAARGIKTTYVPTPEIRELTEKDPDHSWWGDRDIEDKERWGQTFSVNRDSGLLEQSNFETISKDITERFPEDARIIHSTHWAVGWIEQLFVRMYNDEGPTEAYEALMEWKEKMESYPVADESDFSNREVEAAIENIGTIGRVTEEQASEIAHWLWDNEDREMESVDGQGAWPSDASVKRAKKALNIDQDDEEE